MLKSFTWAILLAAASWASVALAGEVREMEFRSEVLGRDWQYSIYLPDGYGEATQPYPVLYLLHGNSGDHRSWPGLDIADIADGLIAAGEISSAVIVMPEANTTWYVDSKEPMETAIMEELIPLVENNYRVASERAGRFVGGYSMGGYGAMRFAMKYPERFAGAALLSPAIYNPVPPLDSSAREVGVFGTTEFDADTWMSLNYPELWADFLNSGYRVPMYINSGDDDQFYIEQEATDFYSLLRRNGLPAQLRIVNGGHTNEVWGGTVDDALRYLLGR